MSLGTLGLAFLAEALSVLSPCLLPLLPIMLGSATICIASLEALPLSRGSHFCSATPDLSHQS